MKPFLNTISLLCCLAIVIPFLPACNSNPSDDPSSDNHILRFAISTEKMTGVSTRSIDEEHIENLRVFCFDSDGKVVGNYGPEKIISDNQTYSITLETPYDVASIALLANWEVSVLSLDDVTTLNELRNREIPASTLLSQTSIPMYGEASVSSDAVCNVQLVRSLAKIEIHDLLDDYQIISASLNASAPTLTPAGSPSSSSSETPITFSVAEDEDNNYLYAYIPPVIAGDDDSPLRKIDLELINNQSSAQESYTLWLKDYSDDETKKADWIALQANHRYVFNVKGIDQPTPPEQEQGETIEIRWWPTRLGKYALYHYGSADLFPMTSILMVKEEGSDIVQQYSPYIDRYSSYQADFELVVKIEHCNPDKLYWIVADTECWERLKIPLEWDDLSAEKLSDSFKNFEEKDGIKSFNLTTVPILYRDGGDNATSNGTFPTDRPYRICWKNKDISVLSNIYIEYTIESKNSSEHIWSSKITHSQYGKYTCAEYELPKKVGINNQTPKFYHTDYNYDPFPYVLTDGMKRLMVNNFFLETIDGTDYYVFYLD